MDPADWPSDGAVRKVEYVSFEANDRRPFGRFCIRLHTGSQRLQQGPRIRSAVAQLVSSFFTRAVLTISCRLHLVLISPICPSGARLPGQKK